MFRQTSRYANVRNWWAAAARDANHLYGLFDALAGGGRRAPHLLRYGAHGGAGTVGGIAAGIPSHAALGRTSVTRLGAETVQEVVVHEVGHTLGLRHTNTQVPATATPPGCYGLAAARGSDWPFADNRIQSAARLEVACGRKTSGGAANAPNVTSNAIIGDKLLVILCIPSRTSSNMHVIVVRRLTRVCKASYSCGMISDFQELSDKIDQLADMTMALRRENAQLRQANSALAAEAMAYQLRLAEASRRVSALLAQIPAEESNAAEGAQ